MNSNGEHLNPVTFSVFTGEGSAIGNFKLNILFLVRPSVQHYIVAVVSVLTVGHCRSIAISTYIICIIYRCM